MVRLLSVVMAKLLPLLALALTPSGQGNRVLQTALPHHMQRAGNGSCAVLGCNTYNRSAPCSCNWACFKYQDCCPDFQTACNGTQPSPGPAPPPSGPQGGPEQLHLALTNDVPRQYVVSFATSPNYTATPTCSAGTTSRSYTHSFTGTTHTYTAGNWDGLLHTVVLAVANLTDYESDIASGRGLRGDGDDATHVGDSEGAAFGSRVYYSCDGGHTEFSFPIIAPQTFPISVGVVADLGEECNRPGCGNSTITALTREVDAGNISLLVHAGDIAYTSGQPAIWDSFMREMEPASARVPYMVCVGNHEHFYNFTGYLNRFAMPGVADDTSTTSFTPMDGGSTEAVVAVEPAFGDASLASVAAGPSVPVNNLWHSYDHGGAHFLAYSTEHNLTQQLAFIEADLAAAAANRDNVPWIVVYGHRPVYCSTNDYYDCEVKGPKELGPALEPLLQRYGVDLYLAGHLHNYERSFPVFNGTRTSTSYDHPNSTVHVVVGMAGSVSARFVFSQWLRYRVQCG